MFKNMNKKNIDQETVEGFGDEWGRFDQSELTSDELTKRFNEYFSIFPWDKLPKKAIGFDLGCGSGRWAKLVAPKVKTLYCIDPSSAITAAKKNLSNFTNCVFYKVDSDFLPMKDNSMDFGYSLGVLHHIPEPLKAMQRCVEKIKPGGIFLVYLYYSFENKPKWFRLIWELSNVVRLFVSKTPNSIRYILSQFIAIGVYYPLTRIILILEYFNFKVDNFPLSYYRNYSFYSMRTDALDRFGTRLEHRFSKNEVKDMMKEAGLENIKFSNSEPYWCAMGFKK
jgi:ubiquinone/menaquinone biosynthesis C-methylase UbiE